MIKYLFLILGLVISFEGKGQDIIYAFDESVIVSEGGNSLRNPWAGGFNSAQYSSMDLNYDGLEDLVVFERTSNRLSTFLVKTENGQKIYVHEPRYEKMFPEMVSWLLLVDYNNDGKKDIFTHANLGVMVYKNTSPSDSITWKLMADPLYSKYSSYTTNIMVNITDLPAIEDIDNDGDVDILNFNFFSGSQIECHKNMSKEYYGTSDSLSFKDIDDRWGGITEGTCNYTFGPNSPVQRVASTQSTNHTGAAFLALKDMDGDGDKEVFASKETCDILNELINKGSSGSPLFNSYNNYPNTAPISFIGVPGVFFEDLDFDGIRDLVATPSLSANNSNNIDFQHSCWFYKNSGTNIVPNYQYVQKNFLQNTMIEQGENASPAFADYDADGDLDMFIANKGLMYGANFYGTISLYQNIGDPVNPKFNLINSNYLNLSSKLYTNIRLAFTDINGDNSPDITFTCYNGTTYNIKYILNSNAAGQPFLFNISNILILPITIKNEDIPFFYDVDNDNKQDILLARQSGRISYFRNISAGPSFSYTLIKDTLGGILNDSTGIKNYLAITVADLEGDGNPDLVTGDNSGKLKMYSDFKTNLTGSFVRRNLEMASSGLPYSLGKLLNLSTTDLNNDNIPEIFIGNNSGGLLCLNKPGILLNPAGYVISGFSEPLKDNIQLSISPNPASSEINIETSEDCKFTMINMLGNIVRKEDWVKKDTKKNINIENLEEGLYLIKFLSTKNESQVKKLIILR